MQLSAPNASGGFHCIDEYDVMCYADGSHSGGVEINCTDPADDGLLLDCNHDDYFPTAPVPGSYLATHWNAANNRFLIGAQTTLASSPPASTASQSSTQGGKRAKHKKGKRPGKNKSKRSGGATRNRSHDRNVIRG